MADHLKKSAPHSPGARHQANSFEAKIGHFVDTLSTLEVRLYRAEMRCIGFPVGTGSASSPAKYWNVSDF